MSKVVWEKLTITTTGSAGSATGNATTEHTYSGRLAAVGLDYHASAPASTVVVISEVSGQKRTLFTAPASATDVTFYPTVQLCGPTGTALTYDATRGVFVPVPLNDEVKATVTLSNALTGCVVVYLYFEVD